MLSGVTVAAFFSLIGTANCQAATFCVSPNGSDTNPGTQLLPLASLDAARDAARKAGPGPHCITVMPGEYFLAKPFELDAQDNGLTIEAAPSGKAILYGGVTVTGWKRDGDTLWYADLPGVKEGTLDFRTLVVNGQMPERARFPESGTFTNQATWTGKWMATVGGGWDHKPTREELTTMPYDPKDLSESLDVKNAEVQVYHMWDESLIGVSSNDIARHALFFTAPTIHPPAAFGVKKYVVWNTHEGMTKPGQWYLDRSAGRVVYWPLPGEDMAKANVIAPKLLRLIYVGGTQKKPVERITIRGLSLQGVTTPLKSAGMTGGGVDATLHIAWANQCIFEQLEVCNVGSQGIASYHLSKSRIVGCHVHHIGACGIRADSSEALIASNHIHHVGANYLSSVAVAVSSGSTDGVHVYRNEIHDTPYSGVVFFGNNHLLEENCVYRAMRILEDGAAFYGSGSNMTLRGNIVRDVVAAGGGFGASAYYLDEGARDCVVERNVALGVPMPTHNHITRNITVRDNVFVSEKNMTVSFARSADCTFERNTLFIPGSLKINQQNGIKVWKDNVIFRNGLGKDDAPQAFTIDGAMPLAATPSPRTWPVAVLPIAFIRSAPTIDGDLAQGEWPEQLWGLDRDATRQSVPGAPVFMRLAYDTQCLYVALYAAMFDPAKIQLGATYGKDDGAEICIAGKTPDGKPATFVVRGYANGTVRSVADAGLSADAAAQFGKEIRFAAKVTRAGRGNGWRGEFALPWAALGLKPDPGMKTAFNAGVFASENGFWHCWEGTLSENWRLEKGSALQLDTPK